MDRLPTSERRAPENAPAYSQQGQEPRVSPRQGDGQDLQEPGTQETGQEEGER